MWIKHQAQVPLAHGSPDSPSNDNVLLMGCRRKEKQKKREATEPTAATSAPTAMVATNIVVGLKRTVMCQGKMSGISQGFPAEARKATLKKRIKVYCKQRIHLLHLP